MQLDLSTKDAVKQLASTVKQAVEAVMIGTFVLNIFLVGSLSLLLGFIMFMQYGANLFLMNVRAPASVSVFVSNLANLVAFDFYNTDDIYDQLFGYNVF